MAVQRCAKQMARLVFCKILHVKTNKQSMNCDCWICKASNLMRTAGSKTAISSWYAVYLCLSSRRTTVLSTHLNPFCLFAKIPNNELSKPCLALILHICSDPKSCLFMRNPARFQDVRVRISIFFFGCAYSESAAFCSGKIL